MRDRLYRSRKTRVLGGVCGGFAEYFNLDPVLVRIIFVIISLINGLGILLYIILWIVLPEESFEHAYGIKPETPPPESTQTSSDSGQASPPFEFPQQRTNGKVIFGIILIVVGLLFFAGKVFPFFDFEDVFPLILIIIGAVLIFNSLKEK